MDRLIKIKRHRRSQRKCERIFKDLVCSSFLSPIFFINCIQVSGQSFTNNHYINYCSNIVADPDFQIRGENKEGGGSGPTGPLP